MNSLRRFHSPSKVTQHSLQRGIERPFWSTEDRCIREATHPPVRATITILHVETILTPAPSEDPALQAEAVMVPLQRAMAASSRRSPTADLCRRRRHLQRPYHRELRNVMTLFYLKGPLCPQVLDLCVLEYHRHLRCLVWWALRLRLMLTWLTSYPQRSARQ